MPRLPTVTPRFMEDKSLIRTPRAAADDPRTAYVLDLLYTGLAQRDACRRECDEIDDLVNAERIQRKAADPNASNVNLPIIRSRRRGVRTRLYQVLFGQSPHVRIRPVKGDDSATGIDWHRATREATDYFEYASRRTDELNCRHVMRLVVMEMVDYGLGVWKVLPYATASDRGVRWHFVSIRDLILPEGLGGDVSTLPYVGQVYNLSPAQVRARKGTWKPDDILFLTSATDEAISSEAGQTLRNFPDIPVAMPQQHHRTQYAELWYTWDDGVEHVADIHIATGRILRNEPAKLERRPFFLARYDERSAVGVYGVGVPRDMKAIAELMNALYNAGVDTVNVATRQARLIRHGSMLADIIGVAEDQIEIGADFQAVTENPDADLVVKPLGDAKGIAAVLPIVSDLRMMIDELNGLGPAQMGNVGLTQRAPASGVARVMAEGSYPIRDAATRLAEAYASAAMFTFDLFPRFVPDGRVYQVLGDDGTYLQETFRLGRKASESMVIDIDVADPARSNDQAQQRALIRAQFVMTWYRELGSILPMLVGAPQPIINAAAELASKSEELVRRVLELSDEVQDPENLLVDTKQMFLSMAAVPAAPPTAASEPAPAQPLPRGSTP